MGIVVSSASTIERDTKHNSSEESRNMDNIKEDSENVNEEFHDCTNGENARTKAKEKEMEEFRKQLSIKREQRREILARHRAEKEELEKSLDKERHFKLELLESNEQLRTLLIKNNIEIPEHLESTNDNNSLCNTIAQMKEEYENLKSNNNKLRRDLAETNSTLQGAYSDIADLNAQNTESIKQINALKEVISVSKTMINLREEQLNELKNKLVEIEKSLADRETNILSADLRQEYERQLQNIRTLRGLYEERARLAEVTRQSLARDLEEHKLLYQAEVNKNKNLAARIEVLETKVDEMQDIIENKNSQISTCLDETNGLKSEMAVVNKLFSQVLLGYKTKQDLDKLVHRLEENHGLLTHMAEKENGSEASTALPKLLLELVSQVDESEMTAQSTSSPSDQDATLSTRSDSPANTSVEEIVENLPKVWRVLIELLSQQTVNEGISPEKVTTCYKSVETKSGPVLVPSVSQTYIRLKDLIMEKLGLVKEVNRMKQLNTHLESRLEEQERRLSLVTTELSKTWHVVGRLRRHHHQLHTHEKILKYELQQKRKLLNELKEELEYCREKWEQAREKNSQSEKDWRKLRAEFSSRKVKSDSPSLNNSGESGYSDERPSDESSESNDESEYITEPLIKCKKKLQKSFETILDSSADFNLAAEREDPVSDMIDVAELPLDNQDGDDNQESEYSAYKSGSSSKNEKVCEETEDEVCDIHDESCPTEELPASEKNDVNVNLENQCEDKIHITQSNENVVETISISDRPPGYLSTSHIGEISQSMNFNCVEFAKMNENLEFEGSGSSQDINQINTPYLGQVENTLINQPTASSNQIKTTAETNITIPQVSETQIKNGFIKVTNLNIDQEIQNSTNSTIEQDSQNKLQTQHLKTTGISLPSSKENNEVQKTDFKAILDSVKRQNERLARRDDRLKRLEAGCSDVVNKMSNTINVGNEMIQKLDNIHENIGNGDCDKLNNEPEPINTSDNSTTHDEPEPSTSNELDHEARFAARDLRLKRLEEQTKCLVNKVNKTTSKGVKIHYKLEELHNIYGSENSRAGTPSDDSEDKSQDDEPRSE